MNTPRDAFRDHINSLDVAQFDDLIDQLLEFVEMFDYEPSYPECFQELRKLWEVLNNAVERG